MSKKKRPARQKPSQESQLAEVLTVGWMLTVLTTLGCVVAGSIAVALAWWRPEAERTALLGHLLLFAGAVSGLVSIGLAGLVGRLRREPVPPPIWVAALGIALAPLAILAFVLWN